jgi:hypothetical protein
MTMPGQISSCDDTAGVVASLTHTPSDAMDPVLQRPLCLAAALEGIGRRLCTRGMRDAVHKAHHSIKDEATALREPALSHGGLP